MSIERGTELQTSRRTRAPEDAVSVMHRALARAERGDPLLPGEEQETWAAAFELAQRLDRLKARGVEFSEIELSMYVRGLLAGPGRVPVPS